MEIKYVHTNIVSSDWKNLANFYIQVFNCKPVSPERDISGEWLEKGTNVKNASIKGIHLQLPGYENNGPTLEIFQYSEIVESGIPVSNKKGFGHIAFQVKNVQDIVAKVIQFGGQLLGEIVTTTIENVGDLCFAYVKDPEENIIEIQNWDYSKK